jgi:hypothetical protein
MERRAPPGSLRVRGERRGVGSRRGEADDGGDRVSTDVKTLVGKFVWHDHTSNAVDQAKSFYTELLGWETEVFKPGEIDYPMIKAGGGMHGGFGPAEPGGSAHWLGHVLVEDVDDVVGRAEAAGGTIVTAPTDIPEVGRFAVIADPQGAVTSAFSPTSTEDAPAGEGVFLWDEVMTTDPEGAASFYSELYGWTSRSMDMGEMGTYTVFQRAGGVDVAGCMARPPGMEAPPQWMPYVGTDDVDTTAARAGELGGTVIGEPADIPGMGRFAVVKDPAGAVFGLFKGSAQ